MIFFSDFDGTLTQEGSGLTRDFFEIIDHIHKHGHELVIVSGRSLSWGHFFLTHFPLKACIMEGGGVICYKDERDEIVEEPLVSVEELDRLRHFTTKLKHHYPHVPLSADSFGRLSDRAIEFHLMDEQWVEDVMAFMKQENIHFSKSNVHINFWCGKISKYLGVVHFLHKYRPKVTQNDAWFFGDAPNDESMFELFHNSVGVSNIEKCLHRLNHKPRIILEGEENAGPKGVLNYVKKLC
ncbi:HAD family hydrolase [Peredibacter starrii]|uniref:HAD-IIB family hydrolase n=1 Tax=Peredibacter starrii TaxID=28202 RepID=A0AAX4HPB0_9BACT|nr:HAD-IIB family hydrolase [Peredibacter starrii]WPU65027.1 HAD-IIB family hydrolase [Peredibacter starrii]